MARTTSFGQGYDPTAVDRLGVALSARAVRRSADFTNKRVADIGCGYQAALVRSLLPEIAHATLVDLAVAEDLKARPDVTVIEAPIVEALPGIPSRSVDVLLCLSVLEHLSDPEGALREFHRLLAPGGVALVNVPTWMGKRFLEFSAFRLGLSPPEEMDDHKWYFDPKDLWPLLVRAGFMPSSIRCHRHKLGLNTFAVCRVPSGGEGGNP